MTVPGPGPAALPVGHPSRPAAARALGGSIAVAALFTVWAYVGTQVHAVRAGSPWQDDPYDALVSLTEFLVPALAVLVLARMWLCRRFESLPLFRLRQLLRAAQVSTGLVAATVAVDWVVVAARADHSLWARGTPLLIGTLVPLSGAVLVGYRLQRAAMGRLPPHDRPSVGDWLDDAPVLAERLRLPQVAGWLRATGLLNHLRGYVVLVAAAISVLASAAVTLALVVGEGGGLPALLYVTLTVIYAAGVLAFCLIANSTLHLAVARNAGNSSPSGQRRQRPRASSVGATAAAAGAYVVFALRDTVGAALLGTQVTTVGELVLISLAGALLAARYSYCSRATTWNTTTRDGSPLSTVSGSGLGAAPVGDRLPDKITVNGVGHLSLLEPRQTTAASHSRTVAGAAPTIRGVSVQRLVDAGMLRRWCGFPRPPRRHRRGRG